MKEQVKPYVINEDLSVGYEWAEADAIKIVVGLQENSEYMIG